MRTCFLHIGTHKTGATAIQHLLASNAAALAAAGVLVPQTGRAPTITGNNSAAHHNIAWQLSRDLRFQFVHGTLLRLCDEIAASSAETVILSSEGFEHLYRRPEKLEELRDALAAAGCTVRILACLRPQLDYAQALYAEFLKRGCDWDVDVFFATAAAQGGLHFRDAWDLCLDYLQLLQPFAEVFGDDHIMVLPYRDGREKSLYARDVLTALTLTAPFDASSADIDLAPLESPISFGNEIRSIHALAALRSAISISADDLLATFAGQRAAEICASAFDVATPEIEDLFARELSRSNRQLAERFFMSTPLPITVKRPSEGSLLRMKILRAAQTTWGCSVPRFNLPARLETAGITG